MRAVLFTILYLCMTLPVFAQKLPGESARLLPQLVVEIDTYWKELPLEYVSYPAGLIDQESNWKPTATLRTSRELGCGLGQFTLAKNADGSTRFDALKETKALSPTLADWDWRDCSATTYQLRAVILKSKSQHRNCLVTMLDVPNALKCNGGAYNGGAGSVAKRQRFCRATAGCDYRIWDGHLDKQCPQAKVKVHGYGESFCDINSKYPGRVFARMPKFQPTMVELMRKQRELKSK